MLMAAFFHVCFGLLGAVLRFAAQFGAPADPNIQIVGIRSDFEP
jgi:hypothetical protein